MTQKSPKRLIEVDLPIEELSAIRNLRPLAEDLSVKRAGLWWSRKPQHQARAVWLATLMPDPADPSCSDSDRQHLREILRRNSFLSDGAATSTIELRTDLIRLCREVAEPTRVVTRRTTETVKELASTFAFQEKVALDPFAGGGSLPVEAQRLGLNSVANDYNPIACLFLRCLMEWGQSVSTTELAAVRNLLDSAIDRVSREVAAYYPPGQSHGQPLGYIRLRRLQCEGPGCGKIVPASSKFEMDTQRHIGFTFADLSATELQLKLVRNPHSGFPSATMRAGALTCPACGFTTRRAAITKQHQRLQLNPELVACVYKNADGDLELSEATQEQRAAIQRAESQLSSEKIRKFIPTQMWPTTELRRFSPPLYGYIRFSDCHSERQLIYLASLCREFANVPDGVRDDLATGLAALIVAQLIDRYSSFCRWRNDRGGSFENTFAGKSLGMIWDFFEADPLHPAQDAKSILAELCNSIVASRRFLVGDGTVLCSAAQNLPLPDNSVDFIYTDPPYYDAIPYSHLSDWSFVWMRLVGAFHGEEGSDGLIPKDLEAVVDRPHSKSPSTHNGAYFKSEMRKAFGRMRQCLKDDGVGVIVFAHQKTAAWESLLEALLESGFCVTASWPILTERGGRLQAQGTASLQSSIHLVVRPRLEKGQPGLQGTEGEWRDVLSRLPQRIHEWLPRLASEGVVGADAIFACLGPALEIFSQFPRVEKADGTIVRLGEYLEHVWAAVAKEALAQVFKGADATGFEPDARLTAMWLWTLNAPTANSNTENGEEEDTDEEEAATKKPKPAGFKLEYDAARKIAQGLGAALETLTHLVEIKGDEARLLPVAERTRHLFGKEQEEVARPVRKKTSAQLNMFAELTEADDTETAWQEKTVTRMGETTLDRVHQAMILFAAGRGEALKRFIVDDGVGRDSKFWRLAQALSALYPSGTDERRWVEGLMARKKQFGF
jgi:putative DNA methylase